MLFDEKRYTVSLITDGNDLTEKKVPLFGPHCIASVLITFPFFFPKKAYLVSAAFW
ncbi:hypothetical protein EMIT07CA2_10229 [Brevibacillus sp. IT-7CA2]